MRLNLIRTRLVCLNQHLTVTYFSGYCEDKIEERIGGKCINTTEELEFLSEVIWTSFSRHYRQIRKIILVGLLDGSLSL